MMDMIISSPVVVAVSPHLKVRLPIRATKVSRGRCETFHWFGDSLQTKKATAAFPAALPTRPKFRSRSFGASVALEGHPRRTLQRWEQWKTVNHRNPMHRPLSSLSECSEWTAIGRLISEISNHTNQGNFRILEEYSKRRCCRNDFLRAFTWIRCDFEGLYDSMKIVKGSFSWRISSSLDISEAEQYLICLIDIFWIVRMKWLSGTNQFTFAGITVSFSI